MLTEDTSTVDVPQLGDVGPPSYAIQSAIHDSDPPMNATSLIQVDNSRVMVTLWTFSPGADTGQHVHAYDYVVVPLTTGTLRLVEPAGVRDVFMQAGASYAREGGVSHNVVNVNDFEFRFVEIELK